jgi:hypothetical protein
MPRDTAPPHPLAGAFAGLGVAPVDTDALKALALSELQRRKREVLAANEKHIKPEMASLYDARVAANRGNSGEIIIGADHEEAVRAVLQQLINGLPFDDLLAPLPHVNRELFLHIVRFTIEKRYLPLLDKAEVPAEVAAKLAWLDANGGKVMAVLAELAKTGTRERALEALLAEIVGTIPGDGHLRFALSEFVSRGEPLNRYDDVWSGFVKAATAEGIVTSDQLRRAADVSKL